MKKFLMTAAAGVFALALSGTANAASTTGLESGFLNSFGDDTWFYNWGSNNSNNHHVDNSGNIVRITTNPHNGDYISAVDGDPFHASANTSKFSDGSFQYGAAVTKLNTLENLGGVTVKGYSGFDANNLFANQEQIIQDYAGSGGLGVMTNSDTEDEQVNTFHNEYLLLSFTQEINLLGLDFYHGSHNECSNSSNRNCGGFNVFALANLTQALGPADAGGDITSGFTTFGSGISGTHFIIQATGDHTPQEGEFGFYLSGIAGNVSAVPLPASILFMLAGLAGIGALRLRRAA